MEAGRGDDQFAEQLAALDQNLADGTIAIDPARLEQDPRLAAAAQALHRLEDIWPRQKPLGASKLPSGFGRFRLIRILGTGGFGIVYLAEDSRLGREVALKMPRPEALVTPTLRERFIREARAVAQLQHPNIVPIFDSGEIGSWCFLVSPYCSGGNLGEWLKGRETLLPCKTAAQLIAILADAVHHAHQRGVLHRDLKPANILLTPIAESAGTLPGFPFTPHIADFGLAKAMHAPSDTEVDHSITGPSMILGTPMYMAPEQARGKGEPVAPATDVYALGVLLYELLTGQPPFRGATHLETLQQIAIQDPVPPTQHRLDVPRELEAICLKSLEKTPGRRYASAVDLAEDLRRFLDNKATVARPLGLAGRIAKSLRQHPALAGVSVVVAAALLLVVGALYWRSHELAAHNEELKAAAKREKDLAEKAQRAQGLAEQRERRLRMQTIASNISVADSFWKEGRSALARELLRRQVPKPGEEDARDFAWRYLWHVSRCDTTFPRKPHLHAVTAAAFSVNGQHMLTANAGSIIQTHDALSGNLLNSWAIPLPVPPPHRFVFSRTNARVAVLSNLGPNSFLAVFQTGGQRPLYGEEIKRPLPSLAMDFSPDGQSVAFCEPAAQEDSVIAVVSLKDGKKSTVMRKEGYQARALAFSPGGNALAAVFETPKLVSGIPVCLFALHHFSSGKQVFEPADFQLANCLVWSANGNMLAAGSSTRNVALWNTEPLAFHRSLPLVSKAPHGLVFAPDGMHLAVIDSSSLPEARKVRSFQVHDGAANPRVFDSETQIDALAWSPNEDFVAIAGAADKIHLWNPLAAPGERLLPGHDKFEAWGVAFSPDGKSLASSGDDHALRFWDPHTANQLGHKVGHIALASCLAHSPDGRWLATGSYDRSVVLRAATKPHEELHRFRHEHYLRCLAFSPDSTLLASAGRDFAVRLWNPDTKQALGALTGHKKTIRALAFAPRLNLLASASEDQTVRLWDPSKQTLQRTLVHNADVWSLAFSPDGQTLATGDGRGSIHFWNVADGKPIVSLHRHTLGVRALAFSPDGRTLASGSKDKTVRLWNPEVHQELFAFPVQKDEVNSVAFSPDSAYLAAALHDGTIALWHGPHGYTR